MSKDLEDYLPFDLPPNLRSLPDKIFISAQASVEEVHDVLEKSLDTIFKATQSLFDAIISNSKPVFNRPEVRTPEPSSSIGPFAWFSNAKQWASEHKYTVLALGVLGTTVVYFMVKETKVQRIKKARARRRQNKSRDVVVVTGVETPLGQYISTYLSKRGFTVLAASADETVITTIDAPELRGVLLDASNSQSLSNAQSVLTSALAPPSSLVPQGDRQNGSASAPPKFIGVVHTIPTTSTSSAQAPLESISSAQYQHAVTLPLLATTTTLQTMLPLMRRSLFRQSAQKPTYYPLVILLFPTLPTPGRIKLQMPYTTAGVASYMSMVGLAASLRRELAPIGIGLTSVHLGFTEGAVSTVAAPFDTEVSIEPSDDLQQAYKGPVLNNEMSPTGLDSSRTPTSHHYIASKIYDMLVMAGEGGPQPPAKVNIGTGAALYDFFGTWMPTFNIDMLSGSRWRSNMRRRTSGYDSDEDYVSV